MDEIALESIDIFNHSIDTLKISPSLLSYLTSKGYKTIGRLVCLDETDFIEIYSWKKELFHELVDIISNLGMTPISFYEEDGMLFINSNKKYPQNLLAAIDNNSTDDLDYWVSVDKKMGVSAALSRLKEREENILLLRYKYGFTLEKIGCFYGLSKERVRQIINETLNKLSESKRCKVLLERGLIGYIENEVEERLARKEKSLILEGYMRGYDEGYNAGKNNDTNQLKKNVLDEPIESLDLSVRTYMRLKRAGVNQIGALLLYDSIDEIIKIRGLGSASAKEIASKLVQLEICNEAWKEFL